MQDGSDCLKGSLFCIWLVLFTEEDEIGMEDLLRKGNKRDVSLVKGTEYYPVKLFFDKEFLHEFKRPLKSLTVHSSYSGLALRSWGLVCRSVWLS